MSGWVENKLQELLNAFIEEFPSGNGIVILTAFRDSVVKALERAGLPENTVDVIRTINPLFLATDTTEISGLIQNLEKNRVSAILNDLRFILEDRLVRQGSGLSYNLPYYMANSRRM